MEKGIQRPGWDEKVGESYVGKYILVGITYLDHKGNETRRQQMHGIIESADEDKGIKIALKGVYDGKTWNMPPDQRSIKKAKPGIYALKMSGEKVKNPDLLSTWTITDPGPDEKT